MKDKELWLNGSGYPDPTAYNAMKGMVDMKGKVGEIWEVNTHKGTKRMLLLAERDGAYTMLEMFDEETSHTNMCVGGYYTNTICLTYGFEGRLKDKVDELDSDRFGDVLESIGCSLDIPMMPVTDFVKAAHDNTLEKNAEIERLKANVEALEIMLDNREEQITCLKVERNKLKAELSEVAEKTTNDGYELRIERDMYKKLYEIAVDRLARKAVGENDCK